MPILNYTTTIDAVRTVGEIQAILAKGGAASVRTDDVPGGGGQPALYAERGAREAIEE